MEKSPLDAIRRAYRQILIASVAMAGSAIIFLTGSYKGIAMLLMVIMIVCDVHAVMIYRDFALMRKIQEATRAPAARAQEQ